MKKVQIKINITASDEWIENCWEETIDQFNKNYTVENCHDGIFDISVETMEGGRIDE